MSHKRDVEDVFIDNFFAKLGDIVQNEENLVGCLSCKAWIQATRMILDFDLVQDVVVESLILGCGAFVKNSTICPGLVRSMKIPVLAGMRETIIEPNFACEMMLSACTYKAFYKMIRAEDQVNQLLA